MKKVCAIQAIRFGDGFNSRPRLKGEELQDGESIYIEFPVSYDDMMSGKSKTNPLATGRPVTDRQIIVHLWKLFPSCWEAYGKRWHRGDSEKKEFQFSDEEFLEKLCILPEEYALPACFPGQYHRGQEWETLAKEFNVL